MNKTKKKESCRVELRLPTKMIGRTETKISSRSARVYFSNNDRPRDSVHIDPVDHRRENISLGRHSSYGYRDKYPRGNRAEGVKNLFVSKRFQSLSQRKTRSIVLTRIRATSMMHNGTLITKSA
jgi:hypothetical protein